MNRIVNLKKKLKNQNAKKKHEKKKITYLGRILQVVFYIHEC